MSRRLSEGRRNKGGRVGAPGPVVSFPWAKLSLVCAVCATIGLTTRGSLAFAQKAASEKRILLLYGNKRVELVARPDSPSKQPDPIVLQPSPTPPLDRTVYPPVGKPTLDEFAIPRNWNNGRARDPAIGGRRAVDGAPFAGGTLAEPFETPPKMGNHWGESNPLRLEKADPRPLPPVPSEEVYAPAPSWSSVVVEKENEPIVGKSPLVGEPDVRPADAARPDPQPVSLAPSPARELLAAERSVENTENPRRDGPSLGWIATGIVQVVGTLIGLFIGLLVFAAAVFLVLRRFGSTKLEPIIRVEISNPPMPAYLVQAVGFNNDGKEHRQPDPGPATRVVDFGAQCIPFHPPGQTYDEQQRAKAQQRKQQEKEVLKRVFEQNVALRKEMSRLMRAA